MTNAFIKKLSIHIRVLLPLLAGTILCLLGTHYIREETGRYLYTFLGWNMFLAWLPVLFSFLLDVYVEQNKSRQLLNSFIVICLGILWLLFYPNAAYLITDLIHPVAQYIKPSDILMKKDMLFWVHLLSFFLAAVIGILLSYFSLYTVHCLVRNIYGKVTGWLFAIIVLLLSSFGIYVGRFVRWDSWDMLTQPFKLIQETIEMLTTATQLNHIMGFSFLIFCCTMFGYWFLSVFVDSKSQPTS